jgi:hypothetical protein
MVRIVVLEIKSMSKKKANEGAISPEDDQLVALRHVFRSEIGAKKIAPNIRKDAHFCSS